MFRFCVLLLLAFLVENSRPFSAFSQDTSDGTTVTTTWPYGGPESPSDPFPFPDRFPNPVPVISREEHQAAMQLVTDLNVTCARTLTDLEHDLTISDSWKNHSDLNSAQNCINQAQAQIQIFIEIKDRAFQHVRKFKHGYNLFYAANRYTALAQEKVETLKRRFSHFILKVEAPRYPGEANPSSPFVGDDYLTTEELEQERIERLVRRSQGHFHDLSTVHSGITTQIGSNFSPEVYKTLLEYSDSALEMAHQLVNVSRSGPPDAFVNTLVSFSRMQIEAISNYLNEVRSGAKSVGSASSEVVHEIFSNPNYINSIAASVKTYFEHIGESIRNTQTEMAFYFLAYLNDPIGLTPESREMRVQIAVDFLRAAITVEPFAAPFVASMEILGEGLASSEAGIKVSDEIGPALKRNPNIKPQVNEALSYAEKLRATGKELGIPESDLNRVANDANHIFSPNKILLHNLEDFLKEFSGNPITAFKALENAGQELWKKGELVQVRSHYEGRAFIKNQSVIVRGNILDGVFRLGTAFIAK